MAEHKECKHYEDCGYRNDIGVCPYWCGMFKHKDDVRVVRCKDCQHCDVYQKEAGSGTMLICMIHSFQVVDPIDFCSYGERK